MVKMAKLIKSLVKLLQLPKSKKDAMRYGFILICFLLTIACKQPRKTIEPANAPQQNLTAQKDTTPKKLIPDNLPMYRVAMLIVNDSLPAGDNPYTFSLLDSLQASTLEARTFYFNAFQKIMLRGDGSLAEALGGYTLSYIQNFTREFLQRSLRFSTEQLGSWAAITGVEIFLAAEDGIEEFNKTTQLLKMNCQRCNNAELKQLTRFNQMMKQAIDENMRVEKR